MQNVTTKSVKYIYNISSLIKRSSDTLENLQSQQALLNSVKMLLTTHYFRFFML